MIIIILVMVQRSPCLSFILADHDDDPDHDHHHNPHDADNVPPVCPIFGLTMMMIQTMIIIIILMMLTMFPLSVLYLG